MLFIQIFLTRLHCKVSVLFSIFLESQNHISTPWDPLCRLHLWGQSSINQAKRETSEVPLTVLGAVHKVRQTFKGGRGGCQLHDYMRSVGVSKRVIFLKFRIRGRWMSKVLKKVLTYFMDGPLQNAGRRWI